MCEPVVLDNDRIPKRIVEGMIGVSSTDSDLLQVMLYLVLASLGF